MRDGTALICLAAITFFILLPLIRGIQGLQLGERRAGEGWKDGVFDGPWYVPSVGKR